MDFHPSEMQALARLVTREEAGRTIALLSRSFRDFVRDMDAQEHEKAAQEHEIASGYIWAAAVPRWHVDRVHPRIDALYGDRETYDDLGRVLKSLVDRILELYLEGAVELHFDRAAACDGVRPSLLGAHYVIVPPHCEFQVLHSMRMWVARINGEEWAQATLVKESKPYIARSTGLVLNLLHVLDLKPAPHERCPPGPSVDQLPRYAFPGGASNPIDYEREPLWHKRYMSTHDPKAWQHKASRERA